MFIQLCLMTVLLLGVRLASLQISGFRFHALCAQTEMLKLNRCVAFTSHHMITSAWTEPDDLLPAAQRVANSHACVGVGYVWWRL